MLILYPLFFISLSLFIPPGLFIFNVKPDLLLLLAVFMGLFGARYGALFSFILGLIKDIFSAGPLGINIFCFGLWFIVALALSKYLYKDNRPLYVLLIACATLGNYLIYVLIANVFMRADTAPLAYLSMAMFSELIYNSLCAYLLFGVFRPLLKRY